MIEVLGRLDAGLVIEAELAKHLAAVDNRLQRILLTPAQARELLRILKAKEDEEMEKP